MPHHFLVLNLFSFTSVEIDCDPGSGATEHVTTPEFAPRHDPCLDTLETDSSSVEAWIPFQAESHVHNAVAPKGCI